jgi:hypothetical protein
MKFIHPHSLARWLKKHMFLRDGILGPVVIFAWTVVSAYSPEEMGLFVKCPDMF